MADGGYYAIKGFSFQFDKTILELLNAKDDNDEISIEQIQDINDNDFVMQVKYKETQDFSDNKVREPVLQLMEEFQKDSLKDYKLYCHFRDKGVGEESIDLVRLNSILSLSTGISKEALKLNERINALNNTLKNGFIKKFNLIFAPNHDAQFEQVLDKLKSFSFVGKDNDDLAILYYSNIVDYLKRIIVNNTTPSNRVCTRKEVLEYLRNGKKLIFNTSYEEYKGKQAFFRFIKTNFIKAKKNQKNLIMLGNVEIDSSVSLSKLIIDITDRYFKKATHDIQPLIFILPDGLILDVKKELLKNELLYNDGYETIQFSETIFHQPAIKTKKTVGNRASDSLDKISFKLRILSRSQFDHIGNHIQYQMIYYFDYEIIEKFDSCPFLKLDNLSTKQIHDIFTF